jgi:3-oxoacyl-[acyl-carrier protein] reductase
MPSPVATITGAGRGIGRAIAEALSARGYRLTLTARSESELNDVARSLKTETLVIPGDVSNPELASEIASKTHSRFGRIDALINNAGFADMGEIDTYTIEQWHRSIETNLSAPFYFSRAVWPIFRAQKSGVIVNVSSVAARDPFDGFVGYGPAKGGLNTLGMVLARQGEKIGVKAYTIAPGATETRALRQLVSREHLPEDKTMTPAYVASFVVRCVVGDAPVKSGDVIWVESP